MLNPDLLSKYINAQSLIADAFHRIKVLKCKWMRNNDGSNGYSDAYNN